MARYSDGLRKEQAEVRLERMRPREIERARARLPAVYFPCGSIEWHGYQNPVGLDALKAHEQLVALALQAGGVVHPPIFFGSGGGHLAFDHTYMVGAASMRSIIVELLQSFERRAYRAAILLAGHYPNKRMYLLPAIEEYGAAGGTMRLLAVIENEIPGAGGDHAAMYETSSMLHLHPETVEMAELGSAGPKDVEPHNWLGDEHKAHPCFGIVGVDPRSTATADLGRAHTEAVVAHLARWLAEAGQTPAGG